MPKCNEIWKRYESSGLTMREFGKIEGMSASMVSYYVRRAKKERITPIKKEKFKPIELVNSSEPNNCIEITTSGGMKITIPIL